MVKKRRFRKWVKDYFEEDAIETAQVYAHKKHSFSLHKLPKYKRNRKYKTIMIVWFWTFSNVSKPKIVKLKRKFRWDSKLSLSTSKKRINGAIRRIKKSFSDFNNEEWNLSHNKKLEFIAVDKVSVYHKMRKNDEKFKREINFSEENISTSRLRFRTFREDKKYE